MTREQLEHIIRASGQIADTDLLIVLGSQSILGRYPDAPARLLVSMEADVYPPDDPDRADLIDGSIGEGSPFHHTFGYYAHGVGPETAILPEGWRDRLVPIHNPNTRGVTGLCLDPHDLVLSKLVAGRNKDRAFFLVASVSCLIDRAELIRRVDTLPVGDSLRQDVLRSIERRSRDNDGHVGSR